MGLRIGLRFNSAIIDNYLIRANMTESYAGRKKLISLCCINYAYPKNTLPRYFSEMLEAVGHEFMETFFNRCESLLAEDGLLILQFISIPEERYDDSRLRPDFISEYIFPGGCLPSLARVTSAMTSSSRLCIEQVENIGIHYYQTLRCWRQNFLERQKRIMDLGFDEKFIRTWEYYFDYCAAGFKALVLGDYQVVFSRPGNTTLLGDPYRSFPSAHCSCPKTGN